MKHTRRGIMTCAAAALVWAGMTAQAQTIYVTPTGTGSGVDWANAASLTNALADPASASDQIWLAQGTYTSDATFTVTNNRALYGGFTNGMATFEERDWNAYPAILDGQATNRRVVTVTGADVVLDGLVITNSLSGTAAVGGIAYAGGIIKTTGGGLLTLANCRIVNHASRVNGVGAHITSGTVLMTNCVVAANEWPSNSGTHYGNGLKGLAIHVEGASLDLIDSVVRDQSMHTDARNNNLGLGLYADNGTFRVLRTEFINNRSNSGGGAAAHLHNSTGTAAVFSNCLFRANYISGQAPIGPAITAVLNAAVTARVFNCSFAFNTNAVSNGGALGLQSGTMEVRNSIFWNNKATVTGMLGDDIRVTGGALRASYSILTGTAARHVYVTGGSATLSSVMTNNPLFTSATDLHVSSPAGRWDPVSETFVIADTVYSPAIDAGDPADPVGVEPSENGGRRNLGAYGGTAQASKSPPPVAPLVASRLTTNDYTRMVIGGELTNNAVVIATVGIVYGTNNVAEETTNGWDSAHVFYPPQQTGTVVSVMTPYLLTNTTYYYRAFASNATGTSWAPVGSFTTDEEYPPLWDIGGGANVIHVKHDADGEKDGRDWHNAFSSIAGAISAISGTRTNIWLTGGTYSEGVVLTLATAATMIGGFEGGETTVAERTATNSAGVVTNYTVINGAATHRCLVVTANGDVWLDTLSISNSPSDRSLEKSSGTGHLTLNNCRLEHNKGAGNSSHAITSGGVGGYFSTGSVLMTNSVVYKNEMTGYQKFGYGISAQNITLDIVDCLFEGQYGDMTVARGSLGGGLAFHSGALRVWNTEFIGNQAAANNIGGGGAIYIGNGATMSAVISNCIFRANWIGVYASAGFGGALNVTAAAGRTVDVVNCSFAAHTNMAVNGKGGAIHLVSGTLNLKNCILWTNRVTGTGSIGHEISQAGGTLNVRYSSLTAQGSPHIDGPVNFANCRAGDPLFASLSDLHLQSPAGRWDPGTVDFVTTDANYSPCIDAGDPADPIGAEPPDNGNARINMGAYGGTWQASKSPPPVPPQIADRGAAVNYHRATVSGELTNEAFVAAQVYLCYGTTSIPGDTTNGWGVVVDMSERNNGTVFATTTPGLAPVTTYYYRWYAVNNDGSDWTATDSFLTGLVPPGGGPDVIHVDKHATGAADGTDWVNAFTTIGAGIGALGGTRTNIWITGDSYPHSVVPTITSDAAVYGGFQGGAVNGETAVSERVLTNAMGVVTNYTRIDGDNVMRCLDVTGGNVWLDTLTLTNANTSSALGKSGAGLLIVNNCRIVGNQRGSTAYGVGCTFTGGSVLMTNSVVSGNKVIGNTFNHQGVGIYSVGANLTMVDCAVSDNDNNGAGGNDSRATKGFGLHFNNGTLEVTRTEFANNVGGGNNGTGGGMAVYLGNHANLSATFRNCVFRGNRALYNNDAGVGFGGAFWLELNSLSNTVRVENCTFADNHNETGSAGTPGLGGTFYVSKGTLLVKNSILWTNTVKDGLSGMEIYADSADSRVVIDYSLLTGTNAPHVVTANGATIAWGDGILTGDPLFASATDVHLQSRGGRWDPGAQAWVIDAVISPAIDAGHPDDPVGAELAPNGRLINLGAYGGTAQASKTWRLAGTLLLLR